MYRFLSRFSLLASVALASGGLCLALAPHPEPLASTVEDTDRDLGDVPVGDCSVRMRISNPTGRPIEVLFQQPT